MIAFSSKFIPQKITTLNKVAIIKATHRSAAVKLLDELPAAIIQPNPVLELSHSATITPPTEALAAIFRAEKVKGNADGIRKFQKIYHFDALNDCINSRDEDSTDLKPWLVFTRVGKKTIITTINILIACSVPNI
jgi:hypothetical protein